MAAQLPEGVTHVLPLQLAVAEPVYPLAVLAVEALVEPPLVCANDAEQPAPHVSVEVAQARLALHEALAPPKVPLHVQL